MLTPEEADGFVLPDRCIDCMFIDTRDDESAWPYMCTIEDMETIDGQSIPEDCPLQKIFKEDKEL